MVNVNVLMDTIASTEFARNAPMVHTIHLYHLNVSTSVAQTKYFRMEFAFVFKDTIELT